jgi:membrane-associated protease RseP (regulator of RpoE activity)
MKTTTRFAWVLGFGLGLVLAMVGPVGAQEGPLKLVQQGVMITSVMPGSSAAHQGLERGDVIVSVNGRPVRSPMDLERLISLSGRVADLDVIDCNTGRVNQVAVYPQGGIIGVMVQTVPLANLAPGPIDPWPMPHPRPRPLPYPGTAPVILPGR